MQSIECKILESLLDSYEHSKLSRGENERNIQIDFIFRKKSIPKYFDESSLETEDIHASMQELENRGWIRIAWKQNKPGHIIDRVVLNADKLNEIYNALNRLPKIQAEQQTNIYLRKIVDDFQKSEKYNVEIQQDKVKQDEFQKDEFQGLSCPIHDITNKDITYTFAQKLSERLENGKSVKEYIDIYHLEDTRLLFDALRFVEENQTDYFIREFSIRHFHDSKIFETLIPKICKILREENPEFAGMENEDILAEYQIYKTPGYVYFKGDARIVNVVCGNENEGHTGACGINTDSANTGCENIDCINTKCANMNYVSTETGIELCNFPEGLALAPGAGENQTWRILPAKDVDTVYTVENLTTFFRFKKHHSLVIYLGGYHNRSRRKILHMIYEALPDARYYHFGDIDAGGFQIFYHLKNKTGIPFEMYQMDLDTLKQYEVYAKPLTENDRRRLKQIMDTKMTEDERATVQYMLEKGIKLEQECIEV